MNADSKNLLNMHKILIVLKEKFAVFAFIREHPLTRSRVPHALLAFVGFQLRSRLLNKKISRRWIENVVLVGGHGDSGITGNFYVGLAEFEEMAFTLHVLRTDDTFVDVGANMGAYSVLAAGAAGAKTVAFEPAVGAYQGLLLNIEANGLGKMITAKQLAVGNTRATARITTGLNTTNHIVPFKSDAESETVKMTVLDVEISGEDTLVLKIDVEGHEFEVLRGAKNLLGAARVLAIIVESNGNSEKYGSSDDEIASFLMSFGYFRIRYDPFRREINRIEKNEDRQENSIFVRDERVVRQRCKSSEPYFLRTGGGKWL